ncbi:condensin complex subunit 3 [Dugong dugon]
MGAEKRLLSIKEAFQLAQQPHQNQAKLVVALSRTYCTMDDKAVFHEEFIHYLKYAMVVYKREPAVERVTEFAAKFVTSFHQSEMEDDDGEEDGGILNDLFTFLLKSHEANSNAVRFRVCQLINKLLGSMPENALIDDDLFDKIKEAMLIRLKDKIPNVRIQAVLALSRLQDPKDDDCPVVNAYATLIENDSNPEVRRAVLSCIAPSAKTLPKIVGRTKDVKEAVRKMAYQVLAEKIHMRAMSIAQRVMLLQQGLNDRSDAVKQATQKHLLQGWLRFTEGDILALLHRLDVENSSEVAVSVLNALFSMTPVNELVGTCRNDARKLIPLETLTPEIALYWRVLCEYLKSKGDDGEEFIEQILPEPVVYAEYLLSYIQSIPVVNDEQRGDFAYIGNLMTKEFIGQQLILIIKSLDTSEEGGRKQLLAILQEILTLPTTPISLICFLVERLLHIITDDNKRTEIVTEIISEIRAPIVTVGVNDDLADARKKELKMAGIKVKLIEAKEALENCIAIQDFNQASKLKEEIKALEEAKINLLKETEQLEIKEVHIEKNDSETLQKCLILCYELLKQMSISTGISATMNGIIESLILPGIISVHPVVRNMAVLCLGCCGLQNKDFASKHFVLLLQVLRIDDVTIKISALKAIFDQLMTFGIEPFKTKKITAPQSEGSEINSGDGQELRGAEEETATAKNVLKLLADFLDNEVSELRTGAAEGLAKLMFSGLLVSSRILSRLILLWYNPVTEEDVRLRHCLGVFFPMFAYASRTNQECFEEAFLPTLQTLANAPASSPLAEIDIINVAELLVDLTRPSGLNPQIKNSEDYQALTVHDNLAIKICSEILASPCSPEIRVYTKALSSLELSSCLAKDLLVLLNEILEQVKDRLCLRALEKMKIQLEKGNKEHGDQTVAAQDAKKTTAIIQNEDEENKEVYMTPLRAIKATRASKSTQQKTNRGRRKVTASARVNRRHHTAEADSESDHEVPEPESEMKMRLPRRAKTAALERSKLDLIQFLSEDSS